MDRHADARDSKRHKQQRGMRVTGRSVVTIQRTIETKAAQAKTAKGGK